jgi:hypothetical protein
MQAATFGCVGLAAVMTRGIAQRMLILVGLIAASVLYALFAKGLGMGHACCFFQDLPRLRGSGCLRSLRQSSMRMRSC